MNSSESERKVLELRLDRYADSHACSWDKAAEDLGIDLKALDESPIPDNPITVESKTNKVERSRLLGREAVGGILKKLVDPAFEEEE
jgi:hypothetical protein